MDSLVVWPTSSFHSSVKRPSRCVALPGPTLSWPHLLLINFRDKRCLWRSVWTSSFRLQFNAKSRLMWTQNQTQSDSASHSERPVDWHLTSVDVAITALTCHTWQRKLSAGNGEDKGRTPLAPLPSLVLSHAPIVGGNVRLLFGARQLETKVHDTLTVDKLLMQSYRSTWRTICRYVQMPQHIELIYLLSVSAIFKIQFGFGVTKS